MIFVLSDGAQVYREGRMHIANWIATYESRSKRLNAAKNAGVRRSDCLAGRLQARMVIHGVSVVIW